MNVGNQVKIKTCGQEGWIYSILDSDKIIVGVREADVVSMRIVSKDDIELQSCSYNQSGICDRVCTASQGMFGCNLCMLERESC